MITTYMLVKQSMVLCILITIVAFASPSWAQQQDYVLIKTMSTGEELRLSKTSDTENVVCIVDNNGQVTSALVPTLVHHYSLKAVSDSGIKELWSIISEEPFAEESKYRGWGDISVLDVIFYNNKSYVLYIDGVIMVRVAIVQDGDTSASRVFDLIRQSDATGDYVSEGSFTETEYIQYPLISIRCVNGISRLWIIEGDTIQLLHSSNEN